MQSTARFKMMRAKQNINMAAFFQLVKQHKMLYVPADPNYRAYSIKEAVWKHISKKLGCSAEYAKKKWKYCRETYMKYRKNVAEAKLLGKKYKVWKYAKDIEFIKPYTMKIDNENRLGNAYISYDLGAYNTKKDTYPPAEDDDSDDEYIEVSDSDDDETDGIEPSSIKSTSTSFMESFQSSINYGATTSHSESSDLQLDAIDMTFVSYSRTIKKLPLKQQSLIKLKIAQLIMKAEIELYK